jgi:hypothetical protein
MVRAWHGRGMASVNETRPHCANQMGKTRSKSLVARHGRGTAWARHTMCESALYIQHHIISLSCVNIDVHSHILCYCFIKMEDTREECYQKLTVKQ